MKNDNHYTLVFVDMLSDDAKKLRTLHALCGGNIELTKSELLGMISPKVGHGTSKRAYDMLKQAFSNSHSINHLMRLMSCHMLAGEGLRVR